MSLPPGVIIMCSGDTARYTDNAASQVKGLAFSPPDTVMLWMVSSSVTNNCNEGARALMQGPDTLEWAWFMGDDHSWDEELLPKLVSRMWARELDVLVPLCFGRQWPPVPVIYDREEDGVIRTALASTIGEHLRMGRTTIEVLGAGSAGMLVRRKVFDRLEYPYFRNGFVDVHGKRIHEAGEDLNFCTAVRAAGFKIHAALDLTLPHITPATLVPVMNEENFGVELRFWAGRGIFIPMEDFAGYSETQVA